jgi:two-component system KDP operon response regulator KdpE
MRKDTPAIIVLDLGLPDADGIELTKQLREWTETPIVVISARGEEEDKVKAFEAGADDYLTKPFGIRELLARLHVALKHTAHDPSKGPPALQFGRLKIDLDARLVTVGGGEVHLTPTEYKCLVLLARHPGKVLTHEQILKEVWGPGYVRETHYVRVRMRELRRKLELDPSRPRVFVTEPGIGYRLKA